MSTDGLSSEQSAALWELSAMLMDHVTDTDQARRVAELMEFFDPKLKHSLSVGWWRRAADAGDEDAVDYLALLIEDDVTERRPNDPPQ